MNIRRHLLDQIKCEKEAMQKEIHMTINGHTAEQRKVCFFYALTSFHEI